MSEVALDAAFRVIVLFALCTMVTLLTAILLTLQTIRGILVTIYNRTLP